VERVGLKGSVAALNWVEEWKEELQDWTELTKVTLC